MNGKEILSQIVQEQLRQLDVAPPDIRKKASETIYGFCLGAASALTKAGLLAPGAEIAIMAALGAELERRGSGRRVTKTFKTRLNMEIHDVAEPLEDGE